MKLAIPLVILLCQSFAGACTICHTTTGQEVREAIFGPGFLENLLLSLTPFPLFAAIVGFIYFRFPLGESKMPQEN
jgi:hypothetical protein